MIPVVAYMGAGAGWQCQLCRTEFRDLAGALAHAAQKHRADPAFDDELDIYNGNDPDFLRADGRL